MTRDEFKALPYLLPSAVVLKLGYSEATLHKFVDCGVLERVCPAGATQGRYQKRQLAALVKWEDLIEVPSFQAEPPLMQLKSVRRWTGYDEGTLSRIVAAKGLSLVKPPGCGAGKFLRAEVAKLIGMEGFV